MQNGRQATFLWPTLYYVMVSTVGDCISSERKRCLSDVKVENMKHLTNIIHKCLYGMIYIYRH